MNSEIEEIRLHYYSAIQSWRRGFRQGVLAALVTALLLGGAMAFLWWLGSMNCM